ncbi:hypothetical protein PIB30_046613 [Stylosanthes scabra]|uniref:GRF-type domain-containing protein n=1 Tax=Stylosanthes scabra TaxID=79078 RepID=A0ABU6TG79_9FABA|nr:hypothetical protein [Stylosanthes scabra]
MDSHGKSATSRRSAGGGIGERSSSSTHCFSPAKAKDEMNGAAPKCHCDFHAVLYLSKTTSNPNRLFFGCPFFKMREPHCKFFLWLDKHASKFGRVEEVNAHRVEHDDAEVEFARLKIETRLSELENRVALIEQSSSRKTFVICVCLIVTMLYLIVSGQK